MGGNELSRKVFKKIKDDNKIRNFMFAVVDI